MSFTQAATDNINIKYQALRFAIPLLDNLEKYGAFAVVGGAPRAWALGNEIPKDIDILTTATAWDLRKFIESSQLDVITRTGKGGYKINVYNTEIDIWSTHTSEYIQNPNSVDDYPSSVFFNIDTLAVLDGGSITTTKAGSGICICPILDLMAKGCKCGSTGKAISKINKQTVIGLSALDILLNTKVLDMVNSDNQNPSLQFVKTMIRLEKYSLTASDQLVNWFKKAVDDQFMNYVSVKAVINLTEKQYNIKVPVQSAKNKNLVNLMPPEYKDYDNLKVSVSSAIGSPI